MTTEVGFFPGTSMVELGDGPITAPSVPFSGTSTEKKKMTRTHPASAVSQGLGPLRYTHTHTHLERQIIYNDVKTCPSGWVSADKLCERAPSKINTGHSYTPLFSQPSPPLPPNTLGDSFRAPMCMMKKAPLGRKTRERKRHLPHSGTPAT